LILLSDCDGSFVLLALISYSNMFVTHTVEGALFIYTSVGTKFH
jgi:hypothetical protein